MNKDISRKCVTAAVTPVIGRQRKVMLVANDMIISLTPLQCLFQGITASPLVADFDTHAMLTANDSEMNGTCFFLFYEDVTQVMEDSMNHFVVFNTYLYEWTLTDAFRTRAN